MMQEIGKDQPEPSPESLIRNDHYHPRYYKVPRNVRVYALSGAGDWGSDLAEALMEGNNQKCKETVYCPPIKENSKPDYIEVRKIYVIK